MTEADDRAIFLEQWRYLTRAAELLEDTLRRCGGMVPSDVEALRSLSKENLDLLDAFAIRYARCQDMTGGTLRSCALLLGIRFSTYQQLLDEVRRQGLVISRSDWMMQRDLRNDIGHKYLGTEEQFVEFYRKLLQTAPSLIAIVQDIRLFAIAKLGFEPSVLGLG